MSEKLGYTAHPGEDHRWHRLLYPRGQVICVMCGEIRDDNYDEVVRPGKKEVSE